MRKVTCLIALLFFLTHSQSAFSQLWPVLGGQRAGTASAQFLKIGVGGRAAGMGEAFCAVSDDATALYWNPAGLVQFDRNEFFISHNLWLVGLKHEFIGYVHHLSAENTLGLYAIALHMDDMEETTELQPFGTGRYFSFGDLLVGLSFARRFTEQFSFGGSVKAMQETLAELTIQSVMIDLGTYYWTGFHSARFAVSLTNFGPQLTPKGTLFTTDGREVTSFQSFNPPTIFRFGFAIELLQTSQQKLTTALQLNHPNDKSENLHVGFEYWWQRLLALRGGYKFNVDEETFSLGAGFIMPIVSYRLQMDYAFTQFGLLGNVNRFSLSFKF
ncbi:PorV/PorQ family protein [candidate division KSB1 bacterium]|nr:PorV/PorQ family protein [candidate division KSB1 bacterium]